MANARTPSTFVISITPFGKDESLDEQGLRGHFARMRDSGIGVYVAGGGSGEAYTLTPDESRRVMEIAAEELSGKVPVRAMGVEPRTQHEMVAFAKVVEAAGLDTMQVYSLDMGHGFAPRLEEMERYYSDVLDAISVKAVLSTHYSVGYFIPVDLIARLCERYPNVIGVNCTTPDVTYLTQLTDALDPSIDLHVGGPMQAMTALDLGASGYLSSDGNMAPKLCVSVIERYKAGDLAGAAEAYGKVLRLFNATVVHGGIRATKALLDELGLPGGIPRRPRLPATDDETRKDLVRVFDELGLRTIEGVA